MKRYKSNVDDKKKLVRRIESILGIRAAYTYVPRCAFQLGSLFVEKDGSLTTENEEETKGLIEQLMDEGLIGGEIEEELVPARVHMIRANRVIAEPKPQESASFFEPVTEIWTPDTTSEPEADDTSSMAWEFPSFSIPVRRTAEEPAEEEPMENDESTAEETETEPCEEEVQGLEAEETPCIEEAAEASVEEAAPDGFPMDAVIGFPLYQHTATSLVNLINTIYSRGSLLSKATGGEFSCDPGFIRELGFEMHLIKTSQVLDFIRDYESTRGKAITGISFSNDKVMFDGFKRVPDEAHLQSFTTLAEKINKVCIVQNRVQAKVVDESNERYALRTWLNRLGMKGLEYKLVRKHLMEHLSGHTAFRTKEEEERAKEKALRNKTLK